VIGPLLSLAALVQPPAEPRPLTEVRYIVAAHSPAVAAEVRALIADLHDEGTIRAARSSAIGGGFETCFTTGLRDGNAIASCVRDRLPPEEAGRRVVALVTGGSAASHFICTSRGGSGFARIENASSGNVFLRNESRQSIARCVSGAVPGAAIYRPLQSSRGPIRELREGRSFTEVDPGEAQNSATDVASLVVESVDVPNARSGRCAMLGYVGNVERGTAIRIGERLRVSVPCSANGGWSGNRSAQMSSFRTGRVALIYLGSGGTVQDLAPDSASIPMPRAIPATAAGGRPAEAPIRSLPGAKLLD
jgi:hypothetical protein